MVDHAKYSRLQLKLKTPSQTFDNDSGNASVAHLTMTVIIKRELL